MRQSYANVLNFEAGVARRRCLGPDVRYSPLRARAELLPLTKEAVRSSSSVMFPELAAASHPNTPGMLRNRPAQHGATQSTPTHF